METSKRFSAGKAGRSGNAGLVKSFCGLLLAGMVCLATPGEAWAVLVSHSTAGTLINDGFESNADGDNPAGWTTVESYAGAVQVEDALSNEGAKSLAVFGAQYTYQDFGSPLVTGTNTAHYSVYISSVGFNNTLFTMFKHVDGDVADAWSGEYFIGLADNEFIGVIGGSIPADTGAVAYFNGSGWEVLKSGGSDFTFPLDAWHDVSLSLDIPATIMTVAIDGTTLDALTVSSTAWGQVNGFVVRSNDGNGGGYIDATVFPVPQPASLAMVALGSLVLMMVSRRKHS